MTLADHLQSKKEILSNRFLNVIFYACGCFASMHVCAPHAYLVSWSPKESTGSLGTEDTDLCALPRECWELHSGPLITQLLPSSHNGYLFVCLF